MANIFKFQKKTVDLLQRMFLRSIALAALTILGFYIVELLVQSGIGDKYAIVKRFPEFIPVMLSVATVTFIEMSVFWIRMSVSPANDAQDAVRMALNTSMGAAIVHVTNTVAWIFRICLVVYLIQT